MKILWLTTFDKQTFGRTELFGMTKSLIKKGHELIVIGSSRDNAAKEGPIVYVKNPFNRLSLFKIKLALYIPWLVARIRPDFIIVEYHSAFIPIILLLLVKLRLYRNNLIHDVRTIPVNDFDPRRMRLFRLSLHISRNYYLAITTITRELKKTLCQGYNIPPEKVGIWSSGVDLDLFRPQDGSGKKRALGLKDKFIVFYHGSVGYRRGIVEVVKAMALLRDKYEDICFFILGSGMEMETVYKVIDKEKLDNIFIHKPVSYEDVPSFIAIADVCIVPLPDIECWRVSSPLKLMEYLAMGKPVILSDIIAHREIIKNDEDALFIREVMPEAISEAIETSYWRRDKLQNLGKIGSELAQQHHSWDFQAEKLIEYLRSLDPRKHVTS